MSAPKSELTPELRAVIQRHDIGSLCDCPSYDDCLFAVVREVVEIVARKDAEQIENDIYVLQCAVENMRSADHTPRLIEARWSIAYKLEQMAKRLRAALERKP